MRDLNDIVEADNRRIADTIEGSIPDHLAKGRYIVKHYTGLHFIGFSTHPSWDDAAAKAAEINAQVGQRATVMRPTIEPVAEAA